MTLRRALAGAVLAALLMTGAAACSSSNDDSGAVTNLDDVGPQLAKLRLEVESLREEVRALREQVAVLDPSSVTTTSTTTPLR
jgi:outer membrane murein-binding lipoprotein Lpp